MMDGAWIDLTKSEIADLKARLAEKHTAEVMANACESIRLRNGPVAMIQSGVEFLRDAYVAAEFARARNAEKVRLMSGPWPDFELTIDGRVELFEATEAYRPGRRRGDEYRNDDGSVLITLQRDWVALTQQAPAWIEAACRRKLDKRYGSCSRLVIYLDMNEFGDRQKEVEACFAPATHVAKDAFEAIWVLWKKRAYEVW